jgi:phosphocarrier protein
MKKAKATVRDTRGLHLTPSAKVVRAAQQFESQITLRNKRKEADARSLLQVLTLGAGFGAHIEITASGPDEKEAIGCMVEVFNDGAGI